MIHVLETGVLQYNFAPYLFLVPGSQVVQCRAVLELNVRSILVDTRIFNSISDKWLFVDITIRVHCTAYSSVVKFVLAMCNSNGT
jgi:hypothetical protein